MPPAPPFVTDRDRRGDISRVKKKVGELSDKRLQFQTETNSFRRAAARDVPADDDGDAEASQGDDDLDVVRTYERQAKRLQAETKEVSRLNADISDKVVLMKSVSEAQSKAIMGSEQTTVLEIADRMSDNAVLSLTRVCVNAVGSLDWLRDGMPGNAAQILKNDELELYKRQVQGADTSTQLIRAAGLHSAEEVEKKEQMILSLEEKVQGLKLTSDLDKRYAEESRRKAEEQTKARLDREAELEEIIEKHAEQAESARRQFEQAEKLKEALSTTVSTLSRKLRESENSEEAGEVIETLKRDAIAGENERQRLFSKLIEFQGSQKEWEACNAQLDARAARYRRERGDAKEQLKQRDRELVVRNEYLRSSDDQLKLARQKADELVVSLAAANREAKDAGERIDKLRKKLVSSRKRAKELEDNEADLNSTVEGLKVETRRVLLEKKEVAGTLAARDERISRLVTEADQYRADLKDLQLAAEALQTETDGLREDLVDARRDASRVKEDRNGLRDQILALNDDVLDEKRRTETALDKVLAAEENASTIQQTADSLSVRVDELTTQLGDKDQEIQSVKGQIRAYRKSLKDTEAKLDEGKTRAAADLKTRTDDARYAKREHDRLGGEIEDLKSRVREKDRGIKEKCRVEAELAIRDKEVTAAREEHDRLGDEIKDLRSQLRDKDKLEANLAARDKEVQELKSHIRQKDLVIKEKGKVEANLAIKVNDVQHATREHDRLGGEIKELRSRLVDKQNLEASLTTRDAEARVAAEKAARLEGEVEELKFQLLDRQNLEAALTAKGTDADVAREKVIRLEGEVKELKSRLLDKQKLEAALTAKSTDADIAREKVIRLEGEIEKWKTKLGDKEKHTADIIASKEEDARGSAARLQGEVDALRRQLVESEQQHRSGVELHSEEARRSREKVICLEGKINTLNLRIETAESAGKQHQREAASRNEEIGRLRNNETTSKKLHEENLGLLRATLRTKNQALHDMQSAITDKDRQIAHASSEAVLEEMRARMTQRATTRKAHSDMVAQADQLRTDLQKALRGVRVRDGLMSQMCACLGVAVADPQTLETFCSQWYAAMDVPASGVARCTSWHVELPWLHEEDTPGEAAVAVVAGRGSLDTLAIALYGLLAVNRLDCAALVPVVIATTEKLRTVPHAKVAIWFQVVSHMAERLAPISSLLGASLALAV